MSTYVLEEKISDGKSWYDKTRCEDTHIFHAIEKDFAKQLLKAVNKDFRNLNGMGCTNVGHENRNGLKVTFYLWKHSN